MPRRVTLPGADELFRSTGSVQRPVDEVEDRIDAGSVDTRSADARPSESRPVDTGVRTIVSAELDSTTREPIASGPVSRQSGPRRPSGRQRHEEKITVYVSPNELVDLEHARLALRAEHSLAVDRGRIVREALAVVLADLEAKGEQSILVRRLRSR
jgi:hypothetical protein